ncbi:MAG: AraC family transcriptional regulator ligand-binding domain-containing protein, partial [Pseudomonadota bacterium]
MSLRPPDRTAIPMSLVRASLEGAVHRGVPLRPLLRLAELSPDALDGDGWVASEQFARLLQAAGHTMRDEGVGFLERPIRPGSFSMMCHATISAPNLRRALLRAARYWRLMREDLVIRPSERGEECIMTIEFPGRDVPARYFVESFFVLLIRWASWMIDANILLNRTGFTFGPAAYADEYEFMFPGQHYFDQPVNFVAFSSRYLSMPVAQDTQTLSTFLARAPAGLLRQHRNDVSLMGQVRKMLSAAEPPARGSDRA